MVGEDTTTETQKCYLLLPQQQLNIIYDLC